MTLIAIRVEADYAELLTDTLTYSVGEAEFGHTSKVRAFLAKDMVLTGKGAAEFTAELVYQLEIDSLAVQGIDDLDEFAPDVLTDQWGKVEQRHGTREHAWVYAVGWSEDRRRFAGTAYTSETGFQPVELMPGTVLTNPALSTPAPEDWPALAEAVYAECSVTYNDKTLIGGALELTRLERGSISQRKVHELPEDDWRFRKMLIGTLHPYGQLGPCYCGSGQPQIVCCLALGLADPTWPCPCTSGAAFADCHLVDLTAPESVQHWVDHADDFHRSARPLRAAWRTWNPGATPPEPHARIIPPPPTPTPRAAAAPWPSPGLLGLSRPERRAAERLARRASTSHPGGRL